MGQFYNLRVRDDRGQYEFRDSAKIITLKISEIPKAFGFKDITKGEIDYHKPRPVGYEPDEEELDYLNRDCKIAAMALLVFFTEGHTKMTKGADALDFFIKKICGGEKKFRRLFPEIKKDCEEFLRKSYKGGFVYVNPVHKNELVGNGIVLDVNSLFPSRMRDCVMPYGEPVYFTGKYKNNQVFSLFVQHLRCSFVIKEGKIPTIQIKKSLSFVENDYLETSNYEVVDLYLTSVDLELFLQQYNVFDLEYIDGYMMKGMLIKEFRDYVDYWGERKIKHGKEGNKGLRTLDKFFMNCLYGKLGSKSKGRSKIPYYEDGKVKFHISEEEERKQVYIPAATFITSYARYMTIVSSQKIRDFSLKEYGYDAYLYSDTDSIHTLLSEEDVKELLEVDDNELGKWAIETRFSRAKFLRQKCYVEEVDGKLKVTVAGLPPQMHDLVSFDNFKEGVEYYREEKDCTEEGQGTKKRFKRVPGGIVLVDTSFKIKG